MRSVQTFEVAIKALLVRDGRLLLLREAAGGKLWELPGGRIDQGEEGLPQAEVLRRELREELGPELEVEIGRPLLTWVRPFTPPRSGGFVFLVGLACAWRGGEPRLSDEHVEWEWVTEATWIRRQLAPGYEDALAAYFRALASPISLISAISAPIPPSSAAAAEGIEVRETKELDLAEVRRLRADAGFAALSDRTLRRQLDGARWVLSAWQGRRLVGMVRAISDGESIAYVSSMMVDGAFRRRGIGRELLRRLTADRPTVRFVLHSRDEASTAFYRSQGFAERTQMMTLDRVRDE